MVCDDCALELAMASTARKARRDAKHSGASFRRRGSEYVDLCGECAARDTLTETEAA